MEAIKISVEVSVNLSENTQNFIKSLFTAAQPVVTATASAPTKPAAPAQPKSTAPTTAAAPAASAPSKPAATPAPGAPAAQTASSASKSIEDVRGMLAKKVNDHRDAIKQKLNSLGAPSVTKLDPAKYDEMYDFLAAL